MENGSEHRSVGTHPTVSSRIVMHTQRGSRVKTGEPIPLRNICRVNKVAKTRNRVEQRCTLLTSEVREYRHAYRIKDAGDVKRNCEAGGDG